VHVNVLWCKWFLANSTVTEGQITDIFSCSNTYNSKSLIVETNQTPELSDNRQQNCVQLKKEPNNSFVFKICMLIRVVTEGRWKGHGFFTCLHSVKSLWSYWVNVVFLLINGISRVLATSWYFPFIHWMSG